MKARPGSSGGGTIRAVRVLAGHTTSLLRMIRIASQLPTATHSSQVADAEQRVDGEVEAQGESPAQRHAMPQRGGVGERFDAVGQLLDREERPREQEQRDDPEPEHVGETGLPFEPGRVGRHRGGEGQSGEHRRRNRQQALADGRGTEQRHDDGVDGGDEREPDTHPA